MKCPTCGVSKKMFDELLDFATDMPVFLDDLISEEARKEQWPDAEDA